MYKYEMHLHTSVGSKCASATVEEQLDYYKALGYTGVCITEHFVNSNTTIPFNLDWEEKINLYCKAYEIGKEYGKKIGLDVFFGFEASFNHYSDILVYGIDKEWLLKHPHCDELKLTSFCDLMRKDGGFTVHAHPFREAVYIQYISLAPRKVDAVEVYNAQRSDFENMLAEQYADNYGLLKSCGSDNHNRAESLTALCIKDKAESIDDIISAIKNKDAIIERYTVEKKDGSYITTLK